MEKTEFIRCPECLIDIEQLDLRLALWEYRRY